MQILDLVREHTTIFIKNNISNEYVFHDLVHTQQVVEAVVEISEEMHLNAKEREILEIAAWFHDTGYDVGQDGHEERSADYAAAFLTEKGYDAVSIEQVRLAILATRIPHQPKSLYEKVMCDADMAHLGKKVYWERSSRIREELVNTRGKIMTEEEWIEFELSFMLRHHYQTPIAEMLYEKRKAKNIKQLRKQQSRLNPYEALTMDEISEREEKQVQKETEVFGNKTKTDDKELSDAIKEKRLVRGVETMYKTTYQTHNNLSALADHKANMMMSICALCFSIIASTLIPKILDGDKRLIIPTAIFLISTLVAIIYATLSTRPKVTEGNVSREDVESRKANLLFFGNFYNMQLQDFQWGIREMIKDPDFLYSTMSRDIYFLGVVLAKKYRYLSICYNVFMYGLIATVLGFAVAFLWN